MTGLRFATAFFLALGLWLGAEPPAFAAEAGPSGLPLPRFVALKSDRINVRAGPGSRYPVVWVFQRKAMPVEVLNEFEQWRKVRDIDGAEGWVQQSLLTGRRSAIVVGERRVLWSEPDEGSIPLVVAEPGVQARLNKCQDAWCSIRIERDSGWMRREHLWGVYPREIVK
jgi:SH3-like domain-containing protein